MTEADVYAEELKTQSIRDLALAKKLVADKGNPEHIAWLCEQSYEKILKHVFATYLSHSGVRVEVIDGKLRRASHGSAWRSTVEITKDVSRAYFRMILADEDKFQGRPIIGESKEVWQQFQESMERMLDTVTEMIELRYNNSAFMQNFNQASIAAFSNSLNPMPNMETLIKANLESVRNNFSEGGFVELTDLLLRLTRGYYEFVFRSVTLAPWLLPLAEASRYPMPEYRSENLKGFRENENQLIEYFAGVCNEVQKLVQASSHFNEAMADLKKFMAPGK
jgi:HEPN domain-containing protein